MKVRIASEGWENFTGSLGFQAVFKDGVSVEDLNSRQINRIGSSLRIHDVETGLQVGPSAVVVEMQCEEFEVASVAKTLDVVKVDEARERAAIAAAEKARKIEEAAALAEAQAKAEEAAKSEGVIVYSRAELEAIAGNNGIQALRDIAKPLGVKGRAIGELVNEILSAQTKQAVA